MSVHLFSFVFRISLHNKLVNYKVFFQAKIYMMNYEKFVCQKMTQIMFKCCMFIVNGKYY